MKTALLVIDMQHFFLSMVDVATPNIINLINHFKSKSLPVVFTQHGHSAEELRVPSKNQLVNRWGPSGSIKAGSPDWELIPEVAKTISERMHVLKGKNTYDAFINTDLEELLGAEGVKPGEGRVVVCGVMTDCCCDTTGRAAFNRGFETWLVKDACGTATLEQHEAGLRGFGYAFGDVVTTKEALKRLG